MHRMYMVDGYTYHLFSSKGIVDSLYVIRGVHGTVAPKENPKKVSQVIHFQSVLAGFLDLEICNKCIKKSHCGGMGPPR